jgi:hypothetical protein
MAVPTKAGTDASAKCSIAQTKAVKYWYTSNTGVVLLATAFFTRNRF